MLAGVAMLATVMALSAATVWAADRPEGAVHDLLDAVEEERFDDLGGLVCEEQRAVVRDRFDISAALPEGVDPGTLASALDLIITDRTVELIEASGTQAEVHVGGRLRVVLDPALVRELAERSLAAFGTEIGPEQIDELTAQLIEQLWTGSSIDDDVTVAQVGATWLVCDDIAVGGAAGTATESTEGMCASMTVAELNSIDEERGGAGFASYARSTWDQTSGLCTYDEGEDGIGSVQLGRLEYPFGQLATALPGGTEETVAGRRAYLSGNDLFVELEDGVLYVHGPAKSTPDGAIDYLMMPAGVAELVLSRIDG
jgi:hypothetical protein